MRPSETEPDDGIRDINLLASLAVIFLVMAAVFAAWLLLRDIDWRAVIDFVAPTAAQARDAGWVALSEVR